MERNIIYRKEFIESVPKGKEEKVLKAIKNLFIELEKNNFNHANIPKGYYIREIKGRRKKGKVYKFRINNGDRVIFTFKDQCEGEVRKYDDVRYVILEYVNHTSQGLVGRKKTLDNNKIDIDLTYGSDEEEDTVEQKINRKYVNYDLDINKYILRVVSIDELANLEDEAIYYLNDEQYECLKDSMHPLFIEGGAGTGKSTIALYKAHQTAVEHERVLYITFSDYLKNEMENSFKVLTKKIDNKNDVLKKIQFESVIKLFNKYNTDENTAKCNIMNVYRFKKWFWNSHGKSEQSARHKIDVDDIWKEIRGVIKGICGKNWISGVYNLEEELSKEVIELLLANKYIKKLKSNQYVFSTNYSEISKLKYRKDLNDKEKADIDKIKEIINRKLASSFMITEDEYLDLGQEFTIYDYEERKYIYNIARKYDEFIHQNNYLDDNDLARISLLNIINGKIPKYDYVIVDEIQDLTEIQIYTLYNLSKYSNNFYMNGDFNQTINPTLFRTKRIESLFKSLEEEVEFIHKEITVNYRNNKGIVNFVNEMIKLRNDFFNEDKQLVKGIKDCNSKPILLRGSYDNNKELLLQVLGKINIAIVVADEEDKSKLLSYIKENMAVEEEQVIGLVYTVNEIKGLEKKYIICYNLISKFKEDWNYMLNNSIKISKEKNVSKYRYYFNMFYVAITRAMDLLCFYEEEQNLFYEINKSYLEMIDEFDEDKISFGEQADSNEQYKYGQLCEKKEDYAAAITAYKNAGTAKGKRAAYRCKGILEKRNGNYNKAISFFIDAKEYILAAECYEEDKSYSEAAECYSRAGEYEKALSIYESINHKEGQRRVLINILNESREKTISEINQSINNLKFINNTICKK